MRVWRTLYAGTAGGTSEISVLACGCGCGCVCGLRWLCACLCVNMRRGGWFSFGPRNPGADLHLEHQMNKMMYCVGKSAVLRAPGTEPEEFILDKSHVDIYIYIISVVHEVCKLQTSQ